MINTYITELVNYGISKGLISGHDRVYTVNRLAELFETDEYKAPENDPAPRHSSSDYCISADTKPHHYGYIYIKRISTVLRYGNHYSFEKPDRWNPVHNPPPDTHRYLSGT